MLLDTHLVLWAAQDPGGPVGAGRLIEDADMRLLSAASVWELAIKQGLGKLRLGSSVDSWTRRALRELAAEPLEVTVAHAARVEHLPPVHRDPFDRLLIAQAQLEGALFLTADRTLAAYGDVVHIVE